MNIKDIADVSHLLLQTTIPL